MVVLSTVSSAGGMMSFVESTIRSGAARVAAAADADEPHHPVGRVRPRTVTAMLAVSVALVAAFDFLTSAELVGSILFTFPLALCTMQRSRRVLWTTALACAALTIAGGWRGAHRVVLQDPWATVANRGLLVASLGLLALLIHVWMRKRDAHLLDVAEIARQRGALDAQNHQLEELVRAATRDLAVRAAAEQHLVQMESRYRGLLEAAPDAMVVVDVAGKIVLLNLQAEQQLGYQRDELVGQAVTTIIPEGFAERLISDGTRTAAEALAQQIGTGIELSARRKDGTAFPIEIMLSPLDSPDGILVTAAIRDISVRKAAALHLVKVEGGYRELLEAAPDAMVVVNERGEIVLLNQQVKKQFGYLRAELLGQPVTTLIPHGFAERLIADGTRTAAEALAQHMGTGIELSGRRKDGSAFPIEIMLSPLEGDDGVRVTAAIRDISVRKAAERHLAQMESRYRGLLEAAPDAMVLVTAAGAIVLVNLEAERMFGYVREELVGRSVATVIPEVWAFPVALRERCREAVEANRNASGDEIGAAVEARGVRKDGSALPIEIALSVLAGAEEPLVTVAIRDITARRASESRLLDTVAELNRSNEELGQFAYIASHDLQEPLRMIASYTQLIARRYKGKLDADADEFIAFAVDGANRMQRLIQDLLSYSRVGTAGKVLASTSSEHALEQAILNLRKTIEDSGAQVTHDPLPEVRADEGQLVQLFQNLVGNAIKYQGAGVPQVHISSARTAAGSAKWMFSVHDNGLGIDPKYFERIFGMFQRLHKREEFEGTGIGLAICKKIVERHGGNISVESRPGEGSTFRFGLTGSEQVS
jgi:PAS domain S-box-containing protein